MDIKMIERRVLTIGKIDKKKKQIKKV